jgi:hypothetical protein
VLPTYTNLPLTANGPQFRESGIVNNETVFVIVSNTGMFAPALPKNTNLPLTAKSLDAILESGIANANARFALSLPKINEFNTTFAFRAPTVFAGLFS